MGNWKEKKLSELLVQRKEQTVIDPDFEYSLVTISNKGEIKLRERKKGALISAQKGYITKAGDFIYSRLSVHTGAFGIVPQELDKALITNEMPCFVIDKAQILPEILIKSIGLPDFLWQLKQLTKGMGRVRIKESMMLSLSLMLPNVAEQRKIVAHFKSVETEDAELKTELTHQQTLLKKLRQQILQEAIEGKLTAEWRKRNPDVEPASELLKRIQAEKAQLIKDKKIKKQKPLPPISEDEKPFALPEGWVWCRLGEITLNFQNGISSRGEGKGDVITVLRLADIKFNMVDLSNKRTIQLLPKTYERHLIKENDILITRVNGSLDLVGNFNYVGRHDEKLTPCDHFVKMSLPNKINSYYVFLTGGVSHIRVEIENKFKTTSGQKTVNQGHLSNLLIPLPPLPEQKAIVAKVEKLLALCDQLESQITGNQSHAEQLMQAVLKEAFSQDTIQTESVAVNTQKAGTSA